MVGTLATRFVELAGWTKVRQHELPSYMTASHGNDSHNSTRSVNLGGLTLQALSSSISARTSLLCIEAQLFRQSFNDLAQHNSSAIGQPVIAQPAVESMRSPNSAMCRRPSLANQWHDPAVPQISLVEERTSPRGLLLNEGLQQSVTSRFESFGWAVAAC